jgi:3-phosphoshikimate 1-carboxyvinyltransferase
MRSSMECYRVNPGQTLSGELRVPGDKSISHRAVMLGGIAEGTTTIRGFLRSEDCIATLNAFARMGVRHRFGSAGELLIEGVGPGRLESAPDPLDLGNSGTAMRLLLGLLAGQGVAATLTGDDSLRRRPMERVAGPLRAMGAEIDTEAGHAPLRLHAGAGLHGIDYALPIASAQIKSAVLLAGIGAAGRTRVRAPGPSRDHTERMLQTMGVALEQSDNGLDISLGGPVALRAANIDVPCDFSSAAFFIVGGCLSRSGPIVLRNVGVNPTRTGLLTILERMGARIELGDSRMLGAEPVADLHVWPAELRGVDVDDSLVPLAIDELPLVFVAAAVARGRTVVRGAAELRVKETDRIAVMARALQAVGVRVEELDDGLIVEGGTIRGGTVDSAGDHRVAMAFAIAALVSAGPIFVRDTRPVATSFPGFVDAAQALGLGIELVETRAA